MPAICKELNVAVGDEAVAANIRFVLVPEDRRRECGAVERAIPAPRCTLRIALRVDCDVMVDAAARAGKHDQVSADFVCLGHQRPPVFSSTLATSPTRS